MKLIEQAVYSYVHAYRGNRTTYILFRPIYKGRFHLLQIIARCFFRFNFNDNDGDDDDDDDGVMMIMTMKPLMIYETETGVLYGYCVWVRIAVERFV